MTGREKYSKRERGLLWTVSAIGFFIINTAFIYGMLFQPGAMAAVYKNPIALAFMVETFILLGVLAYLLKKWRLVTIHWGWFVFLSLIGSMAFALPVVLLWSREK